MEINESLPPWIGLLEEKVQVKAEALFLRLNAKIDVLQKEIEQQKEALKLQAVEYARRLSDLNHLHAQARETLATYVPREVYIRDVTEARAYRDAIVSRVDKIDIEIALWRGRVSVGSVAAVVAVVMAMVSMVQSFWPKL